MIRVAVAYWLLFATAAGPWLCCCTSSRMADVGQLFSSVLGTAGCGHQGCCGHSRGVGGELPFDGNAPGDCPCKAFSPAYAVLPPKHAEPDDLTGRFLFESAYYGVCPDLYALHPLTSTSGLTDQDVSPRVGDARHILAVLQTLRC